MCKIQDFIKERLELYINMTIDCSEMQRSCALYQLQTHQHTPLQSSVESHFLDWGCHSALVGAS